MASKKGNRRSRVAPHEVVAGRGNRDGKLGEKRQVWRERRVMPWSVRDRR